ncbi:uncharacterized protein LOC132799003 [Drosophila nasuta]|uniref:uncharacterized protein LOC132799003 n=1 Tax=Drosophila nasuta TaxID=42062 RepID=UPI00295E6C57|nr:uncharacterized protein LOC132799003 [Drosophila nasuta]
MGAEQSALLVCTQTGKPENPLKLPNAEQYFQMYFDKMAEPRTGPVTEALLHLIANVPQQSLSEENENMYAKPLELGFGYQNDNLEEASDGKSEQETNVMSDESNSLDDSSDSDVSIEPISSHGNCNFKLIPLDLNPIDLLDIDDPKMQFQNEFVIRVGDLANEDS